MTVISEIIIRQAAYTGLILQILQENLLYWFIILLCGKKEFFNNLFQQ